MARMDINGLEEVERAFLLRGENAVKAVPLMLEAGAKVLITAQQKTAGELNITGRSRGALVKSIQADKVKSTGNAQYIEVYPHGTDKSHTRKGVANAEKGFVLEYGRSNMAARPWMSTANEKCAADVIEAQLKEWEAVTDGSG